MSENSVITLHRRVQLCLATSGAIPIMAPVTHIVVGDGGVRLEDGRPIPIPPIETQTALNNRVGIYPVTDVSYPIDPPTTARYTAVIPPADLPGVFLSEAALVDADGYLCAIKTFLPKGKDSGVSFTFEFDDEF